MNKQNGFSIATCCLALVLSVYSLNHVNATSTSPKVVTASEFRLVDTDGPLRGSWVLEKGGASRLRLFRTDKTTQIDINNFGSDGNIIVYGNNKEGTCVWMQANEYDGHVFMNGRGKHCTAYSSGGGITDSVISSTDKNENHYTWPDRNKTTLSPITDSSSNDELPELISVEGVATKNTEPFIVKSHWRIAWETEGNGIFQITVFKRKGNQMVALAANVQGNNSDSSDMFQSGEYYLSIDSTQKYTIHIYSK